MKPRPLDWVLLAALGMVWGAAFMATRVAVEDFGPLSVAGLRLALAAAAILAVLAARGERLPGLATREERGFWAAAVAVGFLSNAMPFSLLSWAQERIDSSLAGVLMTTVPFFVLPLGHLFVPDERMTARKTAGFALGFAGVAVLIGPAAVLELGSGDVLTLLAQIACLGVAVGYASGSIVSKRAPQLGLLRFATASLLAAALMTMPLALAVEDPFGTAPGLAPLAAVLYLGLAPTALATVMLLEVIRSAGPGFLALVNYQVPLWAVVFGTTVMGETPSPRLGIALVMIVAGLAVSQGMLGLRRGGHARG